MGRAEPRFLYWAEYSGGDRGNPVVVHYEIPEHGRGFYTRYRGDRAGVLLRYDREGYGFPRGAYLNAVTGCWRPSESPDRNVWRGSDYGEPISRTEAEAIVAEFGYPPGVLDQPTAENGTKLP